jgi:hypothetical protein
MPKRLEGDPKVLKTGHGSLGTVDRTAKALGWFSIGLGLVELLAPRAVTRSLGMESGGMNATVRAFGAREIAAGVLTLSTEKKIGLWSRVLGDGLDVAVLATGLDRFNPQRRNVKVALATVLGITALDLATASALSARSARPRQLRDCSKRSGFPNGVAQTRDRQFRPAAQHVH